MPVVLREGSGHDRCEFIGEPYMHGCMDGETEKICLDSRDALSRVVLGAVR
jgi:hypothetical protein